MYIPKEGYVVVDFGDVALPLHAIKRIRNKGVNGVDIVCEDITYTLPNLSYTKAIEYWQFMISKAMGWR
jgi:hypothetical protein